MDWGISEISSKEQIKSEVDGIIKGLTRLGVISYPVYSSLVDQLLPLLDEMHELGKKEAVNWHDFPDETPPEDHKAYLVTLHCSSRWYEHPVFSIGTLSWSKNSWQGLKEIYPMCKVVAWAELPDLPAQYRVEEYDDR